MTDPKPETIKETRYCHCCVSVHDPEDCPVEHERRYLARISSLESKLKEAEERAVALYSYLSTFIATLTSERDEARRERDRCEEHYAITRSAYDKAHNDLLAALSSLRSKIEPDALRRPCVLIFEAFEDAAKGRRTTTISDIVSILTDHFAEEKEGGSQ